MIDSHAHLEACSRPVEELIADADAAGVRRVLAIGMDGATLPLRRSRPRRRSRRCCVAIGRHPTEATGFDDADLAELQALAAHERCVAIGETGLDYHRDYGPRGGPDRAPSTRRSSWRARPARRS